MVCVYEWSEPVDLCGGRELFISVQREREREREHVCVFMDKKEKKSHHLNIIFVYSKCRNVYVGLVFNLTPLFSIPSIHSSFL